MYPYAPRRDRPLLPVVLAFVVAVLVGIGAYQLTRDLPAIDATMTVAPTATIGTPTEISLPAAGSTVVAVEGLGVLAAGNETTPRPIASVAKVMTAYLILRDHPLEPGDPGPTITLTQADADRYQEMVLADHSALPVAAGLELTQYELLQGLLIASANNFAEVLAAWDAGSVDAFVEKMNAEASALGLSGTSYADPHGFAAETVSTAADQLVIARAALADPVFSEIVATGAAELPGIGPIETTNLILGENGVFGIKTGYTEEAGGNLAFAARHEVGEGKVGIIGVVLGQPERQLAFEVSAALVARLANGLGEASVVSAGSPVGLLDPAWSGPVEVVAGEDVGMLFWPGMTLTLSLELDAVTTPLAAGERVGWLDLELGEQQRRVPVVLADDLDGPGLLWRLFRS